MHGVVGSAEQVSSTGRRSLRQIAKRAALIAAVIFIATGAAWSRPMTLMSAAR